MHQDHQHGPPAHLLGFEEDKVFEPAQLLAGFRPRDRPPNWNQLPTKHWSQNPGTAEPAGLPEADGRVSEAHLRRSDQHPEDQPQLLRQRDGHRSEEPVQVALVERAQPALV